MLYEEQENNQDSQYNADDAVKDTLNDTKKYIKDNKNTWNEDSDDDLNQFKNKMDSNENNDANQINNASDNAYKGTIDTDIDPNEVNNPYENDNSSPSEIDGNNQNPKSIKDTSNLPQNGNEALSGTEKGIETGTNTSSAAKGTAAKGTAEAGGASATGAAEAGTAAAEGAAGAAAEGAAGAAAEGAAGAAANAAAGAATGGITLAIQAALHATKAIKNELGSCLEKGSADDDYGISGFKGIIIGIIIFVFFIPLFFGSLILNVNPGSSQSYQETQYGNQKIVKRADTNYSFTKDNPEVIEKDYDYDSPNGNSVEDYQKLIDEAIKTAFTSYCDETIKSLEFKFKDLVDPTQWSFNRKKTRLSFYAQRYPYCINPKYSVGDYLKTVGFEGTDFDPSKYKTIPDSELNNDVDYAEIMSVFSQKQEDDMNFDWKNCTLEDYKKFLNSNKTQHLFYEMEKNGPVYCWKTQTGTDAEGNATYEEHESMEKPSGVLFPSFYYKIKVMPYGLRELYGMISLDANASHSKFQCDVSEISNIDMIDRNELYLRTFTREKAADLLGPCYQYERDKNSVIAIYFKEHNTILDPDAPGRSAWFYIEDSLNVDFLTDDTESPGDDEDIPPFDDDYEPNGETVILDMPCYINQGDYPNSPRGTNGHMIKTCGCCDCSYMMTESYYSRNPYSRSQVEEICRTLVDGCTFQTAQFLANTGMTVISGENNDFNVSNIRNFIKSGRPLIFHIQGYWTYNGTVYHSSSGGHFLVIMGYDDTGFYLYDPGKRANVGHSIPYEAFGCVGGKYYRVVGREEFTPYYTIYEVGESENAE